MPSSTLTVTGTAKQTTVGGTSANLALNINESIAAHSGQQEWTVPPDSDVTIDLAQLGEEGADWVYIRSNRHVQLSFVAVGDLTPVVGLTLRGTMLMQTSALVAVTVANDDLQNEALVIFFAARLTPPSA